jgi:hypothetical protein
MSVHFPSHFAGKARNEKVMTRLSIEDKLRVLEFFDRGLSIRQTFIEMKKTTQYI